jgi:hypothetical protein
MIFIYTKSNSYINNFSFDFMKIFVIIYINEIIAINYIFIHKHNYL